MEKSSSKAFRKFIPIILAIIIAASLVYASFFPDLPEIEKANEQPRQTSGQIFQEPPTSNPQVVIVAPPTSSPDGGAPTAADVTLSGILNTLIMVSIVLAGGFGLYFLLRYRRRLVEYVFAFFFAFITFVASFFFIEKLFALTKFISGFSLESHSEIMVEGIIAFSIGLFIAGTAILKEAGRRQRNIAFITLGLLAGALMAIVTPIFIAFPLFLSLAAYDLYAVKHGPIKRIVDENSILNPMIAYETKDWSLGLGDVVFYSMLPSNALAYTMTHISRFKFYDSSILIGIITPWLIFILVTGAIIIAFKKTITLLEKKSLMSGLYLPLLSGCGAFGLSIVILQMINYFGWGWFVPIL